MSEEKKPEAVQEGQRVQVEDKHAVTSYANFCRVTGTPEELIIDFGLNAQPFGVPQEAVVITQRLVTNYFTAKRLLHALHLSVQRLYIFQHAFSSRDPFLIKQMGVCWVFGAAFASVVFRAKHLLDELIQAVQVDICQDGTEDAALRCAAQRERGPEIRR